MEMKEECEIRIAETHTLSDGISMSRILDFQFSP